MKGKKPSKIGNSKTKNFTSKSIELDVKSMRDEDVARVDLEFLGLEHAGPSYEGRVFVNNSDADQNSPTTKESGYVGSYYIFGHGGCFGGSGHCSVDETERPYDYRTTHPLTPIYKRIEITEFIKDVTEDKYTFTVTVVPVIANGMENWPVHIDLENIIQLEKIALKTYR
jgi:hypothetical protein